MTHTPTPWIHNLKRDRIESNGEKLLVNGVALPCGNHPKSTEATANAQFIVQACNAHEELVAALKGLLYEPMAERTIDAAKKILNTIEKGG